MEVVGVRRTFTVVLALIGAPSLAGTALASRTGSTTINLRAWNGDVAVDGALVCLTEPGEREQCARTEDGEYWVDSRAPGAYRARGEAPPGYELVAITCTTFPDIPYAPCIVRGDEVRFVVHKGDVAVTVNFLLAET
jgi:hypothetical protein